jgi:peptidyl-prolyl cis-trans isomerase C
MYYSRRKKRAKKIFVTFTLLAALIYAASAILNAETSHDFSGPVVAKINDEKIFKSEVEGKLHDIFDNGNQSIETPEIQNLPKEVLEILVKEIYLEKKLSQKAEKSAISSNPAVLDKISNAKNKILRQAYIDKLVAAEVTIEKINDKYLELSKELDGKKEYLISHIVVETEDKAEEIAKKLNSSKELDKKFSELAKKYSLDKDSADKDGSLDYVLENNMIQEIAAVVPTLQIGKISKPIQTKFGWHLIKINDSRNAQAAPFEEVKNNIKNQLTQDVINEINSKITNNAKIEILITLQEPKKEPPEEVVIDEEEEEDKEALAKAAEEEDAAEKAAEEAEKKKQEDKEKAEKKAKAKAESKAKAKAKEKSKQSENKSTKKSDEQDKKPEPETKKGWFF